MAITDPIEQSERKRQQELFLQLLLPLRNRLLHFARAMTRNRDEADDLVSDTILAALERFDQVRGHDAFLSYLFTIAVRIHKRKRWRGRFFGSYDEESAASIPYRGTSPESAADVAMLHEALQQLPERQRETVVLFEIADMPLEEIRKIQGGSLSGVKSRLVRGREKLAEILNAEDGMTAPSEPATRQEERSVERPANEPIRKKNAYLIYSEQSHG